MSSCLSGGGRAAYTLDLDIIKSPSTSTRTSSSSPSSTISESSNSPLAISTRKPRTPRKRPNQTYNEAAALLSTAYPNIFSAKDICKPCKFIKPREYSSFSFEESSGELLLPFPVEKPVFQIDSTVYGKSCLNDMDEIGCQMNSSKLCDGYEDFDTESILDEEIGEGVIDSIMGDDLSVSVEGESTTCSKNGSVGPVNFCYGYPVGLGLGLGLGLGGRFDFGFGLMRGGVAKAFRQNDEGDWWRFPAVDVAEISPRFNKPLPAEKKKKLEKLNIKSSSSIPKKENSVSVPKSSSSSSKENLASSPKSSSTSGKENSVPNFKSSPGVLLKLNYDEVLDAWSDRGSPFSDDIPGSEFSGTDALARLAQIDLFGESGALREASVQRYKEKRRTRFFSKKIRYQVRKVNADQRPRMKGRFVRRPNSSRSEEVK
ncbi:protein CHLOROPLAST IMPORT APPARATUS 2 isoform X2 [Beta vulgaris subsp. vulgaris]|uniref:protein CHLOROPLAST IMPORT APPARATUS 2 isoform X2 n=1 Tax=Beta vulgaris subsp. vulgaris TaxID=3555 RepID=UPI0020369790|nr:protein CHLOROPLAST IMPORT APPARATUS 2 isoform X2 [Beta vulgaris subsp. vulgaris]